MAKYRTGTGPIPTPTPVTQPFWDGTKAHRLMLQKCANGHVFYYARTHCPECLSNATEWVQASGRGKLYSYTVVRRPQSEAFAEDCPYVVAAITLDEGPRMTSLLVECDPDDVQRLVDMPVEVVWDDVAEELSMPYFRPA